MAAAMPPSFFAKEQHMQQGSVFYNGRHVPIDGFRTYIYGNAGQKKLVNSWDEFQAHVSTGMWFALKNEVNIKHIKNTRKKETPPSQIKPVLKIETEAELEVINDAGE
jgi:hypothetical protein